MYRTGVLTLAVLAWSASVVCARHQHLSGDVHALNLEKYHVGHNNTLLQ